VKYPAFSLPFPGKIKAGYSLLFCNKNATRERNPYRTENTFFDSFANRYAVNLSTVATFCILLLLTHVAFKKPFSPK